MKPFYPIALFFFLNFLSFPLLFGQSVRSQYEAALAQQDQEAIIGTGIALAEKQLLEKNLTQENEAVKSIYGAIEKAALQTSNLDSKAQGFLAVGKYYSRFLRYEKQALLNLDKAYDAYKKLNDAAGLVEALYAIGHFQARIKEYQNALVFLKDAYELAEKNRLYNHMQRCSEHLSLIYNLLDQPEKADQYQNIAFNISSLQNELFAKNQELEDKNRIILFSVPTAIFASLIGFLLFFGNKKISQQKELIEQEKHTSESLLLNILPQAVANELKRFGKATPQYYEEATVMFTDFKDFTRIAENLTPEELIMALDECFLAFDEITEKHGLERIKTIGDAYMCVGGVPVPQQNHAHKAVAAAIEMQAFIGTWKRSRQQQNLPFFELRLGIHTGNIVAGVVGKKKFAFDIWGDAVNLAARLETASEAGKINISSSVFKKVESQFTCHYRGKIEVKNKGEVEMYYVEGAKAP